MEHKKKGLLCILGCIICYSLAGGAYSSVVLFIDPICSRIGCSATDFSFVFTAIGGGMLLGGVFIGKMLMTMPPKIVGVIGSSGIFILFCALAYSPVVQIIWAAGFIFGLLYGMCATTLLNVMLSSWFNRGRGTLLGIANMVGNGIGIIVPPVIASMVSRLGGRNTALILGVSITVIMVVSCLAFVCGLPSAYGAKPIDLGNEKTGKESDKEKTEDSVELAMPSGHMAATPVFIGIVIAIILLVVTNTMYYNNSMTIYQGFGLDYVNASFVVSIAAVAGMVMSTLFGVLCDRIGSKMTLLLYSVIPGTALCLVPITKGWSGAIMLAVTISCSQCGNMYAAIVLPKLFGNEKSAMLLSWAGMATGIGGMLGAPIASVLAARFGSFSFSMVVAGVLTFISIPITLYVLSDRAAESIQRADMVYRKNVE